MIQRKHRTATVCSCGENLKGIYAYRNVGLDKIDGFGYCSVCEIVYAIEIREVK